MVEAADADGVVRPVKYGMFREDKPAKPGYTKIMYSNTVTPEYYDKLDEIPEL